MAEKLLDLTEGALGEGKALRSTATGRVIVLRIFNETTEELGPADLTSTELEKGWGVVTDSGIETALDDNFARVTPA